MVINRHVHSILKVVNLTCTFSAKEEQDDALPSCFSSHTVNKYPFTVYLVPHFSYICTFSGDLPV